MGGKRKRVQRSVKSRPATDKSTRLQLISLTVSPEQLIKNGDIPKAIDALRTQLAQEPTDERKRLLAHCYFQIQEYKEAANNWLALDAPTAIDLANVGAAWLNEDEWEQARSALQRSLSLEEHAYPLYLQALAIKADREYYMLRGEERSTVINLLQKAQTLDNCPADALLLLDDLLHRDESADRLTLLKDAVQLHPEHTELRLRYVHHLTYDTKDYIEALLAA